MRVLMVSKACLVGAYQRKLEEIARFPDIELTVAVPSSWRDSGRVVHLERVHTEGYELVVEPIRFSGSFHFHFYPRLRRRLTTLAPDIVHIDEEPYNFGTAHALWLAKRARARALWFSWQNLNRDYPLPFRFIESYSLRNADYAIAGSEGAAEVWRDKGYEGPMAVIPQFGVDPSVFAPLNASPLEAGRSGDDQARSFTIGYAGRLVPEKGVDLLLHAVARLKWPAFDHGAAASPESWRVQIVGDGTETESLRGLVHRLGLTASVTFEGWLPSTQMPAFYRQLDVLVLPSRSQANWVEQFGRVLIEAMACGVPVVGSDCGEIPEVVGDAGLVFPEGDVVALRDHLRHLMLNPDVASRLAQRGRQRVLQQFTQRGVAARTAAVYRATIEA